MAVPAHARSLFWDTDVETFEPLAFPRYTIARVLEHGAEDDVAWLLRVFGRPAITDILRIDHTLSRRSANFWALCFGVPRGEVAALAAANGNEERAQTPWSCR